MDTFIEYMVSKKNDTKQVLHKVLIIFGIVAVSFILLILAMMFPFLSVLFILGIFGVIYGGVYIFKSQGIEFEYIVLNSDMDIDKIIAKRKRKRVFSLSFREMEIMAPVNGSHRRDFENHSVTVKHDFSRSSDDKDAYFIIARSKKAGLARIIFTPDERILKAAKKCAPLKVFTD